MTRRFLPILALGLVAACARDGQVADESGVYVTRTTCPQAAIPAALGNVTLFNPSNSVAASAIDVTATITNVRATCSQDATHVVSTATFDVIASRTNWRDARQVTLPYFNVAMQGGDQVVAKRLGAVTLDFPAGQPRASTRGSATVRVSLAAVTLPSEIEAALTRPRKTGDADAAVDPLSDPTIRAAVTRATFEHLVGFQLNEAQLRYNATR